MQSNRPAPTLTIGPAVRLLGSIALTLLVAAAALCLIAGCGTTTEQPVPTALASHHGTVATVGATPDITPTTWSAPASPVELTPDDPAVGHPQPSAAATALVGYLVAHGAIVPDRYAYTVDDNHAQICREYAIGYSNVPTGQTDSYSVNVALAEAAIAASGFCAGGVR